MSGEHRNGKDADAELSFEEAYAELEAAVRRLEEGDLAVEEAVRLFERGMELVRACNAQLDGAELRVRQLVQSPDGTYGLEPFETKQ